MKAKNNNNIPKKPRSKFKKEALPYYAVQKETPFHYPKFVIQASPETQEKLINNMGSPIKKLVNRDDLECLSFFSSPKSKTPRCLSSKESGEQYRCVLTSESSHGSPVNIFMKQTPEIKQNQQKRIKINPKDIELLEAFCEEHPELKDKPSEFNFTITKEDLVNSKRNYKQKNITKYSAKKFLSLVAEELDEDSNYHLSHRQGHCLGGDGSPENLDAATAGSNYTTLCYIESVIYNLLESNMVQNISVQGFVCYDDDFGIVVRYIDYAIYADQKKLFTKRIEHLEYRKPREVEYYIVTSLANYIIENKLNSTVKNNNSPEIIEKNQANIDSCVNLFV